MKHLLTLFLLTLTLSSCDPSKKPAVTGSPYEIFVVCPKTIYQGAVGDTLKSIFEEQVPWLNQGEPIFDLLSIPASALNNINRKHRNLFIVNIDSSYTKTRMVRQADSYASGQMTLSIKSPSADSAALYISGVRDQIVQIYQQTERDRFVARADKYGVPALERLIEQKFDFHMAIPLGYRQRVNGEDYLWIDNSIPIGSQGIFIYKIPMDENADSTFFVKSRDAAVRHIPGPVDGSYMATETQIMPETREVDINGQNWYETRGYWRVEGDFMGGPFANYITIHNGELIGIDLYLQYPKEGKRNYMRQLEALPYTIRFDLGANNSSEPESDDQE
ncbi:MAG: DUF4837 family protein [Rikenellaceae bacterium]